MGVSILIPAFKPTYLRQTIASALAQGVEDYEILIGDNSGGDLIKPIVEQFCDPRIVYRPTAGRVGSVVNCTTLWHAARHDLIQYLFDDDMLLPHALSELSALAEHRPDASLYFGTRYVIDGRGRIIEAPAGRGKPLFEISAQSMSAGFLPQIHNAIGEFNNVLMNRRVGLTADLLSSYEGFDIWMLIDVAFYLSAARLGPAIGIDCPVSMFRKHGFQRSSAETNPTFAFGVAEWEIFLRGERSRSHLTGDQALQGVERLKMAYDFWGQRMPALGILRSGLGALESRISKGDVDLLDDEFRARWRTFTDEYPDHHIETLSSSAAAS